MDYKRLKSVWRGMRNRCNNSDLYEYRYYGARGIKVCEEWNDFEVFKEWAMSHGYDPDAPYGKCTLDRIDVNGNYEPSNCRFASKTVQARNKRNNRFVEIDGVKKVASQWAEEYNIPPSHFYARIGRGEKGRKLLRPCKVYTSPGIEELKQILKDKGELLRAASHSGVSHYTLYTIVNGKTIPGRQVQKRLEEFYNKPKGYFYCEVEDVNED